MKARVDRKALAQALNLVAPAIPLRPSVPILAAVAIEASGDSLSIRATNYELTIWRTLDAEVGDEGEAFVSGHRLRDLASKFSGEDVTISIDDKALVVESGRASYRIALMDAKEFPAAPSLPSRMGSVESADLSTALRTIAHASKGDEIAAVRGMAVEASNGVLAIASTDRHRIAAVEVDYNGSDFSTRPLYPQMVIAAKAVTGLLDIHVDENSLGFSSDAGAILLRLIDGEYLPWRRLVDRPEGVTFSVDRSELDSALERTCIVREKLAAIVVEVSADGLRISVSDDTSIGSERLSANSDSAGHFGLNPEYMRELLACIPEPVVEITAPATPIGGRIKVVGLDGDAPSEDIHVVMSQRLNPKG